MKQVFNSVSEYIWSFPPETQVLLDVLRETIKENAPQAIENIAYGMPAYKAFGKPLVYFAAYKNHIGFYATPSGHSAFAEELSGYSQGKGSVQFQLDKPIPYELVARIVKFRVAENEARVKPLKR